MLHEKHTVIVPASLETTVGMLRDVEAMDGWIRPYLPRRPQVMVRTRVLDRTLAGAPRLVRMKTSAVGITDTSLTEYIWTTRGCETSLRESRLLESSSTAVVLDPVAGGTQLTLDASFEMKIRLPKLVELTFNKYQQEFTSAITLAFIAEGKRRSGADNSH